MAVGVTGGDSWGGGTTALQGPLGSITVLLAGSFCPQHLPALESTVAVGARSPHLWVRGARGQNLRVADP